MDGSSENVTGGQLWRTLSADSGPGTWTEVSGLNSGITATCTATPSVCNINPSHYTISGIALDPNDATGRTAYVSVMGFGVGHVFKTADAGATWARLDGDANGAGLPDSPADAGVADPNVPNLVYVGTDVGVFKSTGDGVWTELGPSAGAGSLPNVAITQLKIYNHPSDATPLRLRASTYGRGIWEISISPVPGYTMAIANTPLYVFAGRNASFSGSITTFNGYTNSINVTCGPGATPPPSTCNPVTIPAPATSGSFTVNAGNSAVGDFSFILTAVGSDSKNLTQQVPVTLHSVDFIVGAVPSATVSASNNAVVSFTVTAEGSFTGDVNLTCSGQPAGTSCTFSPAVVSLIPGATAIVTLNLPTLSSTAPGIYTVIITGTGTLGADTKPHSSTMTLTVTSASQSFSVNQTSVITPSTAKPGQALTAGVNVTAGSGFNGALALSCAFDGGGSPGGSTCSVDPASVILPASPPPSATVTVNTAGAVAGNPRLVVTATDASNHASSAVNFDYSVVDYSASLSTPAPTYPGGFAGIGVTITALNGFAGAIAASCSAPAPLTCELTPAGPYVLGPATTVSATASIHAPPNTPADTYTVAVNTTDTDFAPLVHNQAFDLRVQDFQVAVNPTAEVVKAGATPTPHTINITGQAGFSGTATLACSSGLPALSTCTFSANPVSAGGSSTLTIQTTAPSVSLARPPAGGRPAPLNALWTTIPGLVVGLLGLGVSPGRRRGKRGKTAQLCRPGPSPGAPGGPDGLRRRWWQHHHHAATPHPETRHSGGNLYGYGVGDFHPGIAGTISASDQAHPDYAHGAVS
ncbi:MAG: hypothetical protein ACXWUF_21830 [Methylomagnum sp.]